MSSLMQFNGRYAGNKVGLQACRTFDMGWFDPEKAYKTNEPGEFYIGTCPVCGKHHEVIYEFFRRPAGMLGCWVVFRYNGEEHVPDLSYPISLHRLPRDARRMNVDEASKFWHS